MDPRREALIEILALLEKEGWAEPEAFANIPSSPKERRPFARSNTFLTILAAIAIATNFILIGANHDLSQGRLALLNVVDVQAQGLNSDELKLVSVVIDKLFITIDGEKVWTGKPRLLTGRDRIDGVSIPSGVSIGVKGFLEFWVENNDGLAFLLGKAEIDSNMPDGSSVTIEYADDKLLKPNTKIDFKIKLKIEKTAGGSLAFSRTSPRG